MSQVWDETDAIASTITGSYSNLNHLLVFQIEGILDGFCDVLPIGAEFCHDFVQNNLEGIIDSLVNEYLDPEEICTQLTLCP